MFTITKIPGTMVVTKKDNIHSIYWIIIKILEANDIELTDDKIVQDLIPEFSDTYLKGLRPKPIDLEIEHRLRQLEIDPEVISVRIPTTGSTKWTRKLMNLLNPDAEYTRELNNIISEWWKYTT